MGVFGCNNGCIRSDMISATRFLRSLIADITSSLIDKNHIQIQPRYNLYMYMIEGLSVC